MTALQVATKLNLPHVVKKLVKDNDPLHADISEATALHETISNGNTEIFTSLFNRVVDHTFRQHVRDLTSTHFLDVVKDCQGLLDFYITKVIKKKSLCDTVETSDLYGAPAWLAVERSINTMSPDGCSLLQLAIASGSKDFLSVLLRFGVPGTNSAALTQAVRQNHIDVVAILVRRRHGVSAFPSKGLLFDTVKTSNIELIAILLENRADIKSKAAGGRGVLHEAAASKHPGLVDHLLSRGADACQLDDQLRTPLFDAIDSQDVKTIKYLLQHGVNLEASTIDNRLALHEAAEMGNEEIFILILNRSLEVSPRDKEQMTPMDIARAGRHAKIIGILEARGVSSKE